LSKNAPWDFKKKRGGTKSMTQRWGEAAKAKSWGGGRKKKNELAIPKKGG